MSKSHRRERRPELITRALLKRWPLPEVDGKLGKEARGCVLAIGGSDQNPGGIMLAGLGALRAGAGRIQIATSRVTANHVAVAVPEARVIPLRSTSRGELARGCATALRRELEACDALLIGPGTSDDKAAQELLPPRRRRASDCALVIDAGAQRALRTSPSPARYYRRGVVATPHAGEMASLLSWERSEVLAAPLAAAREAARRFEVVIALKGSESYIVAPDGRSFRNTAGNVGLGTAGSGDVLAGIIAGLLARGADAVQATVWGVHLHATAGNALAAKLGTFGFLARELLLEIPTLLNRM